MSIRRASSSSRPVTMKAKPPYMMTVLSRRELNPYVPRNGNVRAITQIIVTARMTLGSVASEATNARDLKKIAVPANSAISPM